MAATSTLGACGCSRGVVGALGSLLELARFVTMTAAWIASANASTHVATRGPWASARARHLSAGGSPSSKEAAFMSWTCPSGAVSAPRVSDQNAPASLQTPAPRCSLTAVPRQSYEAVEHALKQLFLLSNLRQFIIGLCCRLATHIKTKCPTRILLVPTPA